MIIFVIIVCIVHHHHHHYCNVHSIHNTQFDEYDVFLQCFNAHKHAAVSLLINLLPIRRKQNRTPTNVVRQNHLELNE